MPTLKIGTLAVCWILAACAAEVVRYPSVLVAPAASAPKRLVLAHTALVRLDSGYSRTLASGTEFIEAGTLREGRVLKPTNAAFTVEGRHHHEAYPVLQGNRLVGFYLPVEQSFSPLSQAVILTLNERNSP